ncbi:MAG: cation transporter [Proteobacteria bacterium]|nr:cation transporter [Pseudomonadota bacterium]
MTIPPASSPRAPIPLQAPPEAWALVAQLAARAEIAHHLPGRIRLRLRAGERLPAIAGGLAPERVRQAIAGLPGIRDVRLNLLARSCTIEYDDGAIPPQAWIDLAAGQPGAAADRLLGELAAVGRALAGNSP